jgi:hypothetical protein
MPPLQNDKALKKEFLLEVFMQQKLTVPGAP